MSINILEKLIMEHHEEVKKTKKRLKQQEQQFEENSRKIRQEIEKNRNRFLKD